MPRKGSRRIKHKTHVETYNTPESRKIPKSLIFKQGAVGQQLNHLAMGLRQVFRPHTASKLKDRRNTKLKHYMSLAKDFKVTHLISISATERGANLRFVLTPKGPTFSFAINSFSNCADLAKISNSASHKCLYFEHPVLIMRNFSGNETHKEMISDLFQNSFDSIPINQMKLAQLKRLVLLNYNEEKDTIDFRHYCISQSKDKNEKKIENEKNEKIEENLEKDKIFNLNEIKKEKNPKQRRLIKLKEIGPRMTLQLIKIEEGINSGKVLFHQYIQKNPTEKIIQQKKHSEKLALKEKRREEQQQNILNKKKKKSKNKKIDKNKKSDKILIKKMIKKDKKERKTSKIDKNKNKKEKKVKIRKIKKFDKINKNKLKK